MKIAVCEEIEPIERYSLFIKLFTDRDASVYLPLHAKIEQSRDDVDANYSLFG